MPRFLRALTVLVTALLPGRFQARILACALGWELEPGGARIGLSWLEAPAVRLGPGARIGHLSVLRRLERVELRERASIGVFATLAGRGSRIWTHDWQAAENDRVPRRDPVTVGDRVYVGARAILLPGVVLAEGCTVGAGAVVAASTARRAPAGAALIGSPAQVREANRTPAAAGAGR